MNIPVLGSRIDTVTVYRHGALVSRTAIVLAAQPVPAQVKLVNLPLSLDDGSVRVRVEGDGGELPVASDVRISLDLAVVDDKLPPPDDDALKKARREVAAIAEYIGHLRSQRKRLEKLQLFERPANKRGAAPVDSPVKSRLTMLDFRHKGIAQLDDKIAEAMGHERRAIQVRQDLEHRFKAASKARQAKPHELRKSAIIALRARDVPTAPVRVILEYMVPGARWAPSYAISLAKDMTTAVVSVRAVVAQSTGEDWTGVKLTLATADAQRWTELPDMQVLRIGRRQPTPARRGWRAPPAGAGELYADYDRFLANTAHAAPTTTTPIAPAQDSSTRTGSLPQGVDLQSLVSEFVDGRMDRAKRDEPPSAGAPPKNMAARSAGAPPPARRASAPGGAMPNPAASMQPMPMPEMAAQSKSRGGGLGSAFGAAVGAIGGLLVSDDDEGGGGGGGPQHGGPAGPQEHEAAPDQLAYGNLRMPGPKDSRRGALVIAQRHERYLEMLWVREVTQNIDVVTLIDGAMGHAHNAGARGLPPRHHLATSWAGFDYVYAAESTVDIPSDDDYHGIPLMSRPAPIELGYVVVPRESTDVFRFVKLHNPLDAPLLPGPADIYIGGDYLLSTDLRVAAPRGELKVGLGVEQAIKVSRNTTYAEETAGMLGGSLSLRHEILLEVANRRDRPINLEVQERVPTLREKEDEIQFDLAQVDPPWSTFEPEEYSLKGGYRWQIQVPAGQSRKLRAVYVIKISAKKELYGGNRREL
jgi:hypothetical protein